MLKVITLVITLALLTSAQADQETRWHQATRTVPIWLKLNPIWWFMNDDQQRVDQAPWYEPNWPEWERILVWNMFRNPLQNFRSYVIGVQDRNFWVTWDKPWGTIQRNDLCNRDSKGKIINCQTGYIHGTLWGGDLLFPLPFVSYSGTNVVWYAGWQPGGFAGVKFNFHNSSCGDPNNYSATCGRYGDQQLWRAWVNVPYGKAHHHKKKKRVSPLPR